VNIDNSQPNTGPVWVGQTAYRALQNRVTYPAPLSFRAEFRHPLIGWRNAVEEPAVARSREAGFSTSQDCPRADNLAALEMTEEV
jgi:hypothetical protein